jgi:hypothetical protein
VLFTGFSSLTVCQDPLFSSILAPSFNTYPLAMLSSSAEAGPSKYASLPRYDDGSEESVTTYGDHSLSEDENSIPLLEGSEKLPALSLCKTSQVPKLILYFSFALALLSAVNIALLPTTLTKYHSHPFSDSELENLPHGDARLGLDRAAKMIPPYQVYHRAWPNRIARVSRKLKNAVWGQDVQVYITVEVRKYLPLLIIPMESSSPCLTIIDLQPDTDS